MNLNRAELKKIMYDFNSNSNRLLQADFHDHAKVVAKFVTIFLRVGLANRIWRRSSMR